MVNTKHDTASYESCSYKHDILTDGNALYDAFLKSKKNSDWIYSWMNSNTRYLSNDQRENIYELQEILLLKYYPQSIATKNGL